MAEPDHFQTDIIHNPEYVCLTWGDLNFVDISYIVRSFSRKSLLFSGAFPQN